MRNALALVILMCGMAPASAQGILDRMKEDAQRRAENKALRDAQNPAPEKPKDSATSPGAAPAAPAQAETPAPAAPTSQAAPATPAQAPAQ
jgi:hypothetical protein